MSQGQMLWATYLVLLEIIDRQSWISSQFTNRTQNGCRSWEEHTRSWSNRRSGFGSRTENRLLPRLYRRRLEAVNSKFPGRADAPDVESHWLLEVKGPKCFEILCCPSEYGNQFRSDESAEVHTLHPWFRKLPTAAPKINFR